MISISASEFQKNFGEYERHAIEEPVEVTHSDRSSSYLVSERLFKDMMSSYRRAVSVEMLTDSDITLIESAEVETDRPYDLVDIPDIETPLTSS